MQAGSISGAAKDRVVGKSFEVESFDRGFYTGTFGIKFAPDRAVWNVLIRTLFLEGNCWRFPVGAGITYQSDPVSEWKETLAKAANLIHFCS